MGGGPRKPSVGSSRKGKTAQNLLRLGSGRFHWPVLFPRDGGGGGGDVDLINAYEKIGNHELHASMNRCFPSKQEKELHGVYTCSVL